MSNRACLLSTKFEDVGHGPGEGTGGGGVTYGFRIYDDYSKSYDNNAECAIEGDLELLSYALENGDEQAQSILSFITEEEHGLDINNEWYEWEQIKAILLQSPSSSDSSIKYR